MKNGHMGLGVVGLMLAGWCGFDYLNSAWGLPSWAIWPELVALFLFLCLGIAENERQDHERQRAIELEKHRMTLEHTARQALPPLRAPADDVHTRPPPEYGAAFARRPRRGDGASSATP